MCNIKCFPADVAVAMSETVEKEDHPQLTVSAIFCFKSFRRTQNEDNLQIMQAKPVNPS